MAYIDSQLTSFSEFIQLMTDLSADELLARGISISEMSIGLPIELETLAEGPDPVRIEAGPPTQQVETSFMPLFHHLRLKLVSKDG